MSIRFDVIIFLQRNLCKDEVELTKVIELRSKKNRFFFQLYDAFDKKKCKYKRMKRGFVIELCAYLQMMDLEKLPVKILNSTFKI